MTTSSKLRLSAGAALAIVLSPAALPASACAQTPGAEAAARAQVRDYDIPAQALPDALEAFARQSNLVTLYAPGDLVGVRASAVRGRFTAEQALTRLVAGTGVIANIDGRAITLAARAPRERGPAGAGSPPDPAPASAPGDDDAFEARSDDDDTIVVIGQRLAGASASPVTVVSREEIEQSGANSVAQVMRALPQNFGAGPNEGNRAGEASGNLLEGSSINLRGLGADSTLILINGRRISTGGTSNGLFVDVSSIPVSAIERIEVLTDGASAIYGSDAIGGAVNFVLRDDFDGAETSVRVGAADDGAGAESGFSHVWGGALGELRLFGVYDFYTRDGLANRDRRFSASSDLTSLGGSNFSLTASNPGTIVSPITAAVPSGQDGFGLTPGDFIAGAVNRQNTNEGQDILGEQTRHSLYLSAHAELSPNLELFAEARGAQRAFERNRAAATASALRVPSTHPQFVALAPGATQMILQYSFIDDLGPVIASGDSDSVGLVAGAAMDLSTSWRAELSLSYGSEDGRYRTDNVVNTARLNEALGLTNAIPSYNPAVDGYFNPLGDGANTAQSVLNFIRGFSVSNYHSRMRAFNFEASGELFALPAGALSLALGGELRHETFKSDSLEFTSALAPVARSSPQEERDVSAVFIEARVPLIAPEFGVPLVDRLDFVLAARREDTSNGGEDTTPKLGLVWTVDDTLTFRASWGRSFKAPSLTETVAGQQAALVFPLTDPSAVGGVTTTIVLSGANPDLSSERAETWTAGLSWRPDSVEGFSLDFNAFRIDFTDRIASPSNPFTVLTQPDFYAPIITRDPDDALVQSYFDAPYFIPLGPNPPASAVGAIIDGRLRNLSSAHIAGLDFSASQAFSAGRSDFEASLTATFLSDFEQAFTRTSAPVELVDTAGSPVGLRLRLGLTWRRDDWSGALFVNYVDDYTDLASNPDRRVSAWTTADLSLAYAFDGIGEGVTARLNVRNLFDRDPPFYNNPIGVGYDPENTDPLGRFISFQLTKSW
jgi:outer membrane receptor protein involved in Fe transport